MTLSLFLENLNNATASLSVTIRIHSLAHAGVCGCMKNWLNHAIPYTSLYNKFDNHHS